MEFTVAVLAEDSGAANTVDAYFGTKSSLAELSRTIPGVTPAFALGRAQHATWHLKGDEVSEAFRKTAT